MVYMNNSDADGDVELLANDRKHWFQITADEIDNALVMRYHKLGKLAAIRFWYVYAIDGVVDADDIVTPVNVFDSDCSGELWITKEVRVTKLGCICVVGVESIPGSIIRYRRNDSKRLRRMAATYVYHYITCKPDFVAESTKIWMQLHGNEDAGVADDPCV